MPLQFRKRPPFSFLYRRSATVQDRRRCLTSISPRELVGGASASRAGAPSASWKAQKLATASAHRDSSSLIRRIPYGPLTDTVRDDSGKTKHSTRQSWEDPDFWSEISTPADGPNKSFRLYEAFQKATNSPKVSSAFLIETPVAFDAILDGSLAHNDQTSRHLLQELCQYILRQYSESKKRPPNASQVYRKVMRKVLDLRPSSVQLYHRYLEHLNPREEELASLIVDIQDNKIATSHFQRICLSLPGMRSAYGQIIAGLCNAKRSENAHDWHEFLIANGCLPPDTMSAEPLRSYFSSTQQEARLGELDIAVQKSTLQGFVNHLEDVFPQGKRTSGDFSDTTLARGLATSFISAETAIRGLEFFSVSLLGPLALRQLVLRTADGTKCDLAQLRTFLGRLRSGSIKLKDCVFSRLVQKLIRDERSEMLYEIATCDLHCDVFGDVDLQISLLARFDAVVDQKGIERTTAILLTDTPKDQEATRKLNFHLRSCLIRDDRAAFERTFEQAYANYTPIDFDCVQRMRSKMIQEQESRQADSNINAVIISRIWLRLLDHGYFIPFTHWRVALDGLLFTGELSEYESLVLKLLKWRLNKLQPRRAPSRSADGFVQDVSLHQGRTDHEIAQVRASLDLIFSKNHLTDLIGFGFYFGRLQDQTGQSFAKEAASVGPSIALAAHPILWPLRTVLFLEARGVKIDRAHFIKRFESYLGTLCGPGVLIRDGHTVNALPGTKLEDYLEAQDILIQRIGSA